MENQEFLCATKHVPGNEKLERDWKKKGKNVEFSSDTEVPEWGQWAGLGDLSDFIEKHIK